MSNQTLDEVATIRGAVLWLSARSVNEGSADNLEPHEAAALLKERDLLREALQLIANGSTPAKFLANLALKRSP